MVADDSEPFPPMGLVLGRELEIIGSHGMQGHSYNDLLLLIARERLNPQRLIGKTVTLE